MESAEELEKEIRQSLEKGDVQKAYRLRLELSRRIGDVPRPVEIDFEKYITK